MKNLYSHKTAETRRQESIKKLKDITGQRTNLNSKESSDRERESAR